MGRVEVMREAAQQALPAALVLPLEEVDAAVQVSAQHEALDLGQASDEHGSVEKAALLQASGVVLAMPDKHLGLGPHAQEQPPLNGGQALHVAAPRGAPELLLPDHASCPLPLRPPLGDLQQQRAPLAGVVL